MTYQVPDNENQRLEQLNQYFNALLCSEDYFNDEKWIFIRLNLSKWESTGYTIELQTQNSIEAFNIEEQYFTQKLYSLINQVLLFACKTAESARNQEFEQAALYRDLGKEYRKRLCQLHENIPIRLYFFEAAGQRLKMKFIDNYFVSENVKERLRILS